MISPSSSTAYSKGVIRMDPSSLCVAIFATHSPSCRNCVSSSSVSGGSLTWSSSLVPWCVTPGPRLQSGRQATPTRRGAARPRAAAPSAHDNDLSRYPQRRRRPTTAASSDAETAPRGVVGLRTESSCSRAAGDRGGFSISVGFGGRQEGHGGFGGVGAGVGLPLVVGVGRDGADQADDGGLVGE